MIQIVIEGFALNSIMAFLREFVSIWSNIYSLYFPIPDKSINNTFGYFKFFCNIIDGKPVIIISSGITEHIKKLMQVSQQVFADLAVVIFQVV